jgi:hypothetical protein
MTKSFAQPQSVPLQSASNKGRRIALWAFQIVVAALFLMAGGSKLSGSPDMVAMFDAIGIGQWFRYVTGSIEVGSALMLLIPSLSAYGSVLLVGTMIGAVATHLFVIGGSPVGALVFLTGAAVIAWARRTELERLLDR